MDMRKAYEGMLVRRGATPRLDGTRSRLAVACAALLACGIPAITGSAQAAPGTQPATAQADAKPGPRADLNPALAIETQMRLEKGGNMTGMLSRGFKAAYDAVPRDADNLGPTILAGGYDVPDRVVKVSAPAYDDPGSPRKALVEATLHYTNPDAPTPSFNRNIAVSFVNEEGQWRIDDVRLVGMETDALRRAGKEVWIRRGIERVADDRARLPDGSANPACVLPTPASSTPDKQATAAGFQALTDLTTHAGDPNRSTIATKFADAIGSSCPFSYQLVDLNGDGLADLVIQLSDAKLGATPTGLRRTAVYVLDREGKWKPMIDGLSRDVLVRTDKSGAPEVALSGNAGDGFRSWRWTGAGFEPNRTGAR